MHEQKNASNINEKLQFMVTTIIMVSMCKDGLAIVFLGLWVLLGDSQYNHDQHHGLSTSDLRYIYSHSQDDITES